MAFKSKKNAKQRDPALSSKWTKTIVLNESRTVRKHIPPTQMLSQASLQQFLERYDSVYLKPEHGSHGRGVMKVDHTTHAAKKKDSPYTLRTTTSQQAFPTIKTLWSQIKKKNGGESYIIQKGIQMGRYQGRIYDMRVVTQRVTGEKWELSGMLARVAKQAKIVTNGSQGATSHSLAEVLRTSNQSSMLRSTTNQLQQLCLTAAKHLHRKYRSLRELGFDIAMDQKKFPWILEVNTKPESTPFRKLSNRSMYETIHRNRRKWGSRSTK